ncbi:MAG: hypothetical protein Q7T05_00615 [Dehalococcoidia bacterium]|nr:hypothetical protein [Dehalococcoidia bacterium]
MKCLVPTKHDSKAFPSEDRLHLILARASVLADRYRLPAVYDAHYVDLAEILEVDLCTDDQRLLSEARCQPATLQDRALAVTPSLKCVDSIHRPN